MGHPVQKLILMLLFHRRQKADLTTPQQLGCEENAMLYAAVDVIINTAVQEVFDPQILQYIGVILLDHCDLITHTYSCW